MSVLSVAKSITGVFNWLTSEPKNHFTLRQLLPIVTEGAINPGPPRPINRVARVMERTATVLGLAAGAYYSTVEKDVGPLIIMPLVMQGAAWLAGGLTTIMLEKMKDRADQFERWATKREFNKENKANLPRHQR